MATQVNFRIENSKTSGGSHWYVDGVLKTPELIRDWLSYMKTFEYQDSSYYTQLYNVWTDSQEKDFLPIPTSFRT